MGDLSRIRELAGKKRDHVANTDPFGGGCLSGHSDGIVRRFVVRSIEGSHGFILAIPALALEMVVSFLVLVAVAVFDVVFSTANLTNSRGTTIEDSIRSVLVLRRKQTLT